MENQPLLGPGQHNNGARRLPARSQYLDLPPADVMLEPGPGLLLEYWDIIRRRRFALFVITFLGALAALLVTLPQTPVYQARASLEIQNLNENFMNMREVSPTSSDGASYTADYDLQTQVKILQSESVLDRVVSRLQLEKKFFGEKDGGRVSSWRQALGLSRPAPASPRQDALQRLTRNLKVRTQANTRIVEILYDSTDPQLAAQIANAITTEFIQENLEARWQTTQRTGEWLARQMEEFRNKLEKSEEQLQNYARSTGLLFTSEKENVADEKLRQLQQELSRAQAERVARQSKYELVASTSPDSLPDVLDNITLKEYQVKLTDLRRQLAELSSALTADHPSVKKVQAQVGTLQAARDTERANITGRIRNEFEAAQRRENLLAAVYATQAGVMSGQAAKVTHYNILKREVDTDRQLYDSMLQRVREAGVASALRASNVRVIDSARPPAGPYKPSLPLNLALGLLSGGFLGVVFVVMRERADRSIQAPGETSAYLNVPELGVIPAARAAIRAGHYYHTDTKSTEKETGNVELVTWQKQPSVLADSFRATLASILYSGNNGERPRVIVLTSANPMEGKTTVASNLALALAETGRRVLLIDADLRRPRLHYVFNLPNEWGLSDVLEGKQPPKGREALVMGTGYAELYLLPAGTGAERTPRQVYSALAAELLNQEIDTVRIPRLLHSALAKKFLNRMKKEFDTVLIDTPPMALISDARDLGRLADGVILVVRSTETTREAAAAATQRLMEDGTRVLGTILNQWDPQKTSHYGYGYYHYQRG